jgi:hypothetical protein
MSKAHTRQAISELVLNPSFRRQVARDPASALSRYQLKPAEIEFLQYLASNGLSADLDQHLPPYRTGPGTLGPPGPRR